MTRWWLLAAVLGVLGLALLASCHLPYGTPIQAPTHEPLSCGVVRFLVLCPDNDYSGATRCAQCWGTDHATLYTGDMIRGCYSREYDVMCVDEYGCDSCDPEFSRRARR